MIRTCNIIDPKPSHLLCVIVCVGLYLSACSISTHCRPYRFGEHMYLEMQTGTVAACLIMADELCMTGISRLICIESSIPNEVPMPEEPCPF